MSDEWKDRPAEYWYKRLVLNENLLSCIMTSIGRALPCIQNEIIQLDGQMEEQMRKLDSEHPRE